MLFYCLTAVVKSSVVRERLEPHSLCVFICCVIVSSRYLKNTRSSNARDSRVEKDGEREIRVKQTCIVYFTFQLIYDCLCITFLARHFSSSLFFASSAVSSPSSFFVFSASLSPTENELSCQSLVSPEERVVSDTSSRRGLRRKNFKESYNLGCGAQWVRCFLPVGTRRPAIACITVQIWVSVSVS